MASPPDADRPPTHVAAPPDEGAGWAGPRVALAALWVTKLFVLGYLNLVAHDRAQGQDDLTINPMSTFVVGHGLLLWLVAYAALAGLMVFLCLMLPVRIVRQANIVLALVAAITLALGAVGEPRDFVLGSVVEMGLLAAICYCAWAWPTAVRSGRAPRPE